MYKRLDEALAAAKPLIKAGAVIMVVCALLLAIFYYDMGSAGGTLVSLAFALLLGVIFVKLPRWLNVTLYAVGAVGIVWGGVLLGQGPGDTLFLICCLAFLLWLHLVGDDTPPETDERTRSKTDILEQGLND